MSELKSYEFRCKNCGGVFGKEWTEEKALAEYRKMFATLPNALKEDKAVLCDDCHKKRMVKISQ